MTGRLGAWGRHAKGADEGQAADQGEAVANLSVRKLIANVMSAAV